MKRKRYIIEPKRFIDINEEDLRFICNEILGEEFAGVVERDEQNFMIICTAISREIDPDDSKEYVYEDIVRLTPNGFDIENIIFDRSDYMNTLRKYQKFLIANGYSDWFVDNPYLHELAAKNEPPRKPRTDVKAKKSREKLAEYIIKECKNKYTPVSGLELHRIIYAIQREFLRKNKSAFPDRLIVMATGPAVEKVYELYKSYGASEITFLIDEDEVSIDGMYSDTEKTIIDVVIQDMKAKSAYESLQSVSFPDGAWDRTKRDLGLFRTIPRKLIKKYG